VLLVFRRSLMTAVLFLGAQEMKEHKKAMDKLGKKHKVGRPALPPPSIQCFGLCLY
jgi:hypothetical protein